MPASLWFPGLGHTPRDFHLLLGWVPAQSHWLCRHKEKSRNEVHSEPLRRSLEAPNLRTQLALEWGRLGFQVEEDVSPVTLTGEKGHDLVWADGGLADGHLPGSSARELELSLVP